MFYNYLYCVKLSNNLENIINDYVFDKDYDVFYFFGICILGNDNDRFI